MTQHRPPVKEARAAGTPNPTHHLEKTMTVGHNGINAVHNNRAVWSDGDRADLRDRIAEALMRWAEGNNSPKYASMRRPETVRQNASGRADAVLAELKPELDAIARVRDACEQLHRSAILADGQPHTDRERGIVQAVTRIMAALDEPAPVAQQPDEDHVADSRKVMPLVHVGWWCWRGDNHGHLATMACRSDNVPIHVPAEWADEMRAVIQRIEDGDDEPAPVAQQPAAEACPQCSDTGACNGGACPLLPQQAAAADGEEVVAPHCDGFPTACPNPVPVPPAPPYHDGGFRCGCYDTP